MNWTLRLTLQQITSPSQQPNFDIRGMDNWPNELQELFRNCQNEYHSQMCLLCQKTTYFESHSSNSHANNHPGQSIAIEFQSSGSVLEGTGSSLQGYWVSLDPMELSFITSVKLNLKILRRGSLTCHGCCSKVPLLVTHVP